MFLKITFPCKFTNQNARRMIEIEFNLNFALVFVSQGFSVFFYFLEIVLRKVNKHAKERRRHKYYERGVLHLSKHNKHIFLFLKLTIIYFLCLGYVLLNGFCHVVFLFFCFFVYLCKYFYDCIHTRINILKNVTKLRNYNN